MDYIFRWLQLRFLTGQQQALFDGLRPKYFGAPPVGTPEEGGQKAFGDFVEVAPPLICHHEPQARDRSFFIRRHPDGRRSDLSTCRSATAQATSPDALKELIDMGDAPTCSTCGAIMTRNGSCYRCMSCGSTSGCSLVGWKSGRFSARVPAPHFDLSSRARRGICFRSW